MRTDTLDQKCVRTRVEHRADAGKGRTDLSVFGDVNDVTGERDAEPNAKARAVDGGESRRWKIRDRLNDWIENGFEYGLGVFGAGFSASEIATSGKGRTLAPDEQRAHACSGSLDQAGVHLGD